MKLFTQVETSRKPADICLSDGIAILGSCFADEIGSRMVQNGFNVVRNPFGTLYNPMSIEAAISRLDSGEPFSEDDCVRMGAGSDLICSYWHHTSFARENAADFLDTANARLKSAADAWAGCSKVILTLGTAYVWKLKSTGAVVANCLKQPASTFTRDMMSPEQTEAALRNIISSHPDKQFILTVSPIRHMSDGAHSNTLSKATLQLAADRIAGEFPERVFYFPAYEILLDELRDYRFYAEDLVHPSSTAVEIIWERFVQTFVPDSELGAMAENAKAFRRSQHRPLHLETTK